MSARCFLRVDLKSSLVMLLTPFYSFLCYTGCLVTDTPCRDFITVLLYKQSCLCGISEMSSADKAAHVNTAYGTNLGTLAAAGAQRVVYSRKIVLYLNRAVRTGLFALHTADTAVRARLSRYSALVVI